MAYVPRFSLIFAAAAVLADIGERVGAAILEAVGWLFSAISWRPDAEFSIAIDRAHASLQASTLELTPLGERFKAFIRRRMNHRRADANGFPSEGVTAW